MHQTRRPWVVVGLLIPLALAGCTPGTPEPTSSTSPAATSTAVPGPGGDAAAAAELVRDGAPSLPQVAGTTTLVADGEVNGCEFAVFSATATASSTVLNWGIQCGDRKPLGLDSVISVAGPEENLPALSVGEETYKVTRYGSPDSAYGFRSLAARTTAAPNARPLATTYAPLPPGTSSVQVTSPVFAQPVTVPVTAPDLHAGGTPELPILARTTMQGTSSDVDVPLLAAVHGVRRVPHATAVYYPLAPATEGQEVGRLLSYGEATYAPAWMRLGLTGHFVNAFASFDYADDLARGQFGRNGYGDYSKLAPGIRAQWALESATSPLVFVAYLPETPASTSTIDLLLGGRAILQDLPVSDGALTPTSEKEFPALGTGWPAVQQQLLDALPPEEAANITRPLIEVVTDGKIANVGDTLELNSEVLFNYNEATLTPAASEVIDQAAKDITAASTTGAITITGHTDNTGSDSYNLDLSQRRAQAVADALRPLLPAGITMTVDGKGETEPTADNATDAGKAANRRVTITLPK